MNECPICYQNRNLDTLSCSHSFCRECLNSWRSTCPLCRSEINSSVYRIRTNNLVLENSNPRSLNISIKSKKGTSLPILESEIQVLKNIFGNFIRINYSDLRNFDKILFQNYINNCWWIGQVINIDVNKITIDNSIYLQRSDGTIYNASPEVRTITFGKNDTFFTIS